MYLNMGDVEALRRSSCFWKSISPVHRNQAAEHWSLCTCGEVPNRGVCKQQLQYVLLQGLLVAFCHMVHLHLLANMQPPCSFIETQFSGHKTFSPFIDKAIEALPTSFVLFLVFVNSFMWVTACMFQTSLELPLFFVSPWLCVCQMLLSCWQHVGMSFKIRWSHNFEISSDLSRLNNPFLFSIPFP